MRVDTILSSLGLTVGLVGFLYFGWLTIQAAWLSATPDFPAEVAERAAWQVGTLAIVFLIIAGIALFRIIKK